MQDRRQTLLQMLSLTTIASLSASPSQAGSGRPEWADLVNDLTQGLRSQSLSETEWRASLDSIFNRFDLADILASIKFDALASKAGFARKGVSTAPVKLSTDDGRGLSFFSKIFAIDRGRAIIPHGHSGMISAHLPLKGQLYLRQYDQLGRSDTHMVIEPSSSGTIGPGDLSSIGLAEDNVHWFVAQEPSYTLDVIVTGLVPEQESDYDIFNLDIQKAEKLGGGVLKAPIISVEAALEKYG